MLLIRKGCCKLLGKFGGNVADPDLALVSAAALGTLCGLSC